VTLAPAPQPPRPRSPAQLDRQLHRLTKSLAEHDRFASPNGESAPGGDGPVADGEPDPPATAPPEAAFRPAEAAPARDRDEAVEHDGATGRADPPTGAEAGPHPVAFGLARRPAFSATDPGFAPTARPERPNEAEAEGERVAAPATPPGRRAGPEGGTGGPAAAGGTVETGAAAPRAGSARHALPNLPNEPAPGAPLDRARPESGAECAGADGRDRRRAEARVPDAALPTPTPKALLARGDLEGYLRPRTAPSPRHPPPTAPSAGPPRAAAPPHHPPPRGKPEP